MGITKTQKPDLTKYVGKEFSYGTQDCYSLLIEFYKNELNIEVPKIPNTEGWWEKGENLYLDSMDEAGYIEVNIKDIQIYDIILICLASKVPNHAAIYLGDGKILHHVTNRLSNVEALGGIWFKNIHTIARYAKNERRAYNGTPIW